MTSRDARHEEKARKAFAAMSSLVLTNVRRREVSDALGLPFGKVRALRRIAEAPMTMGQLAHSLTIDAPAATLVVDELEERGLVERTVHPTDRRAKIVTVTPAGAEQATRANEILSRPPQGLAALSTAQLETLRSLVESALGG